MLVQKEFVKFRIYFKTKGNPHFADLHDVWAEKEREIRVVK